MALDRESQSAGKLRLIRSPPNEATPAPRPQHDDTALLASIRAGEVGVASELCVRLAPRVDRTIRRLLGRLDSDHEDLIQVSLMEIVNTIGRYRGECSLDHWAQTVTAHVVFKHIRRRNIERRLFSELLADGGYAALVQVEKMSVSRQLLGRIAAHLDGMNTSRAWTFLLHDVMGYDLQEIAAMLSISIAAAQSRLSRGRRELHDRVARDPELADLLRSADIKNDETGGDA